MAEPTYSFVVPVFNEEPGLEELHRRISAVAESLDGDSEMVFVDDGSSDGSAGVIARLREADPRVKLVSLSRNFGHQIAISAGLDFVNGKAVVIMDADLQDPPELVPELVEKWRQGYEVVYAVRRVRPGDSRLRRALIRLAYRVLGWASESELPLDAGDFRLVDRRVVDIVRNMPESKRYLRGMFAWVGFSQIGVPYERPGRYAGDSKYSLSQLIALGSDGLISFSTAPLRLALALGFGIAALAFAAGIAAAVLRLVGAFEVPGWASLIVVLSFFAGVQLTVLGAVGLYVGRIFDQSKGRPLYLVRDTQGFSGGTREVPGGRTGPEAREFVK